MEQYSNENAIVDFFKTIYSKITGSDNKISIEKAHFIDAVASSRMVTEQLFTTLTNENVIKQLIETIKGNPVAGSPQKNGIIAYKLFLAKLKSKASSIERNSPFSSIAETLKSMIKDYSDIESQYVYLLGGGQDKVIDIDNMKLSLAIVAGYLKMCNDFNIWCFNLISALTTEVSKSGFLKYQLVNLLNTSNIDICSLFVSVFVDLKPTDTILKTIQKLKTTKNDVYLATQDKTIAEYLPTNTLSSSDTFRLSGFVKSVDSMVSGKNFMGNPFLGAGRWIMTLWRFRNDYDKEMRNYLVSRIEALNLKMSTTADPVELNKLEADITDCTDKLAYYSKRIDQYENS